MRRIVYVIALSLVSSACSKGKSCPTQTVESFVGSSVPNAELATALTDLASRNKVCGTSKAKVVISGGSRSTAMDAIHAALKNAGFHDVPGRGRSDGSTITVGYFKGKDATNGDLVELAVSTGDDCEFGDVCVENMGYSVVPR
jgi:hypothetical protein